MFLSLLTDNNYMKFYEEMLKTRYNNISTKKHYILINKNQSTTIVYPFLKIKKLSADDVLEIIKILNKEKYDRLTILCNEYDKETPVFLRNFNQDVMLLDKFESYSLYKEYDFFPQITNEYKKEAKLTFKDLLSFAFNRTRSKGYVLSAIFLFITSFFVEMNIYYCVVSSILLILALVSYINPKYNKKIVKEVI